MRLMLLLFANLCITLIMHAQVSKTIEVTAGNLSSKLTVNELKIITNLTLNGTIDVRDFETMRDDMPLLAEIDMSEVTILAGRDEYGYSSKCFPANAIPSNAFSSLYLRIRGMPNDRLKSIKIPLSCTTLKYRAFCGCSGLTSVIIPTSVSYIEGEAFQDCSALTSISIPSSFTNGVSNIFANCTSITSIYLQYTSPFEFSSSHFDCVDKSRCTLYVPNGSKDSYAEAYEWKDFKNIVEMPYLDLSATKVFFQAAKDITTTINIDSDFTWTVNSNKSWLKVNPDSGRGNQKLTISADVNTLETKRTGLLIFTIDSFIVNTLIVYQTGATKLINVTAGELESLVSDKEVESLTSLNLSGTINKSDFDFMRSMPLLYEIDLSGVDILADSTNWRVYPANTIPEKAFGSGSWWVGEDIFKNKIISLPVSCTSIEYSAFSGCFGITSLTIPSSVISIMDTFYGCSRLTSIIVHTRNPVDMIISTSIFSDVDKSKCTLFVPYGTKNLYTAANKWKDFTNIVEIPFIELFKTQLNLTASQGSSAITKIVSDVSWTASSDQDWLTLSQSSGVGDQTLIFTADTNSTSNPRTASVTVSADGVESQTITVTQEGGPTALPDLVENSTQFKCYPNPFAENITIEINNPKRAEISVDIYNLAGERIKNLAAQLKDEKLDLNWNGTNDSGQKVVSGVYVCKVNNRSKRLVYLGQKGN